MFSLDEIKIDIEAADQDVVLITIETPVGTGQMLGRVRIEANVLYIDAAHIDGMAPGRLGRAGINAILRKLLVDADVERLVIQGETRSTGLCVGKRPRLVEFPH